MRLPGPWDAFDAYLFDIDGTLLNCTDAVHYFAFCDALSSVAGFPMNLDGVSVHGNTDVGILRDAFALSGVTAERWRPRLAALREQMGLQVERNRAHLCANVLPGVRAVLQHLRGQGAVLSTATGNLERIGKQKLLAAELLDYFTLGGWSDAFEQRADVFRHAVEQVHAAAGSAAAILVVGDTPADIAAARANRLPVLAVATGVYSFEELTAEDPSLCLHTLSDLFQTTGDQAL
jgi:phosphoglycolate phosphatase